MLEGFGIIKFFLGILKGSGELGKISSKVPLFPSAGIGGMER